MTHHARTLAIAASVRDRDQQARAHTGLGNAYAALGQKARSREHLQAAADIYSALGYPEAEAARARLAHSGELVRP